MNQKKWNALPEEEKTRIIERAKADLYESDQNNLLVMFQLGCFVVIDKKAHKSKLRKDSLFILYC